jgi:hypothetical protein
VLGNFDVLCVGEMYMKMLILEVRLLLEDF